MAATCESPPAVKHTFTKRPLSDTAPAPLRFRRMRRTAQGALFVALLFVAAALFAQSQLQVGYAVIAGATQTPVSTALFSYVNDGVLVSEAAVGGASPIRTGRIFVDETETQTGVALANPSQQPATATLILRDSSGTEISRRSLSLGAQAQHASYVSQLFPNRPADFTGSLTFD